MIFGKEKIEIFKFRGILHIIAKFQGVFDHNRKQLTEKFDGGGKLINVMQF